MFGSNPASDVALKDYRFIRLGDVNVPVFTGLLRVCYGLERAYLFPSSSG